MQTLGIGEYLHKLFSEHILVYTSMALGLLNRFLFPEEQYLLSTLAVLGIMVLDVITKMFALKVQNGGWKNALMTRKIRSSKLFKGTIDKLTVFGIMLIICGCAYRLSVVSDIAVWFTQVVFTLMFLRDCLSILENLRDAGVGGLGIFEKIIKKKIHDYVPEDDKDEDNDIVDNTFADDPENLE